MIIMHESAAPAAKSKPVTCPKCGRGKIGNIHGPRRACVSRRGKPPSKDRGEGLQVKCTVCNSYWLFTIE